LARSCAVLSEPWSEFPWVNAGSTGDLLAVVVAVFSVALELEHLCLFEVGQSPIELPELLVDATAIPKEAINVENEMPIGLRGRFGDVDSLIEKRKRLLGPESGARRVALL